MPHPAKNSRAHQPGPTTPPEHLTTSVCLNTCADNLHAYRSWCWQRPRQPCPAAGGVSLETPPALRSALNRGNPAYQIPKHHHHTPTPHPETPTQTLTECTLMLSIHTCSGEDHRGQGSGACHAIWASSMAKRTTKSQNNETDAHPHSLSCAWSMLARVSNHSTVPDQDTPDSHTNALQCIAAPHTPAATQGTQSRRPAQRDPSALCWALLLLGPQTLTPQLVH